MSEISDEGEPGVLCPKCSAPMFYDYEDVDDDNKPLGPSWCAICSDTVCAICDGTGRHADLYTGQPTKCFRCDGWGVEPVTNEDVGAMLSVKPNDKWTNRPAYEPVDDHRQLTQEEIDRLLPFDNPAFDPSDEGRYFDDAEAKALHRLGEHLGIWKRASIAQSVVIAALLATVLMMGR